MNDNRKFGLASLWLVFYLIVGGLTPYQVVAAEPVCARVKIEISQELTLERQAFDAMMRINNGLDNLSIDNVNVTVSFQDELGSSVLATSDPNDTTAKFFIRIDSMDNISDVSGNGSVAPQTTAEIHWLIIPASGAAGSAPNGKLHFVGATLSYTLGGEPESVEVTPDFIVVKPLPQLTLDYFLTQEVRGDDPLTAEIEPIEPFTLGVRIKNNGIAPAESVKIDSAQPKIVENEQGLLIGFEIIGSTIDGQPSAPVLLADFGQIEGNSAKVGRWQMTSTLAGEFVDFTATFSHADELGGAVTSILEATNSHLLMHDVRVDLPGRDGVKDFLAMDGDVLRLYESHGVDSEVVDHSDEAVLSLIGQSGTRRDHQLTFPVTAGFSYIKLPDPYAGAKVIKSAIRADSKPLPGENVWLSRTRNRSTSPYTWDYFINLLDAESGGSYTLQFDDAVVGPEPPVLQFITNRTTYEGNPVGFQVVATDPNGDVVSLSASPLPAGVTFMDSGDGTATFNWTPAEGQAGSYTINFVASDGQLNASQAATIVVNPLWDTDGDGMADAWELAHFGNLDRDGTGDFDGDGTSDLQEYLDGSDPASGPQSPVIQSPLHDVEVATQTPTLVVSNVPHAQDQTLTYTFELYADEGMTELVARTEGLAEGSETTSWNPTAALPIPLLDDNHRYRWRVRSYDGNVYSLWSSAAFFVNTENDAPGVFAINSPIVGAEVNTLSPVLTVTNSVDVDQDAVHYGFKIYDDSALTSVVAAVQDITAGEAGTTSWQVDTSLIENNLYYWQATAVDEHGAETLGPVGDFFVNTGNDAPGLPTIQSPPTGSYVNTQSLPLSVLNAIDPDGDALSYTFELDKVATFDSVDLISSGAVAETNGATTWHVEYLEEDQHYYWRVKVFDGVSESDWVQSDFIVNAINAAPGVPTIQNPGEGAWVATLEPTLLVNASTDPDGDAVQYRFELYSDPDLAVLVADQLTSEPQWLLTEPLINNQWYRWRVRAEDPSGAQSAWSPASTFFTDDNGVNDTPTISFIEPAAAVTVMGETILRWDDQDPDSNAQIALYYDTDNSGADGTLIVDGLKEDNEEAGDFYHWDVTQVPPGTYWVYAVIDDGYSSTTVYLAHTITIQATEITLDNTHPDVEIIGEWKTSSWISGFIGTDYRYHAPYGPTLEAMVVDNTDPGYSTLGDWHVSTWNGGYYGDDYQYLKADGAAVEGEVLDNQDSSFSVTGEWKYSSNISGFYGTDYRGHAANGTPPGIVTDNADPDVQIEGVWATSSWSSSRYGADYLYREAGDGSSTVTWPVSVTESGHYQVYVRWIASTNRASNAPYTMTHDGGADTVRVDQRNNDGEWVLLGDYDYTAGTLYSITLSDDADGLITADAVKLVPENAGPNTATWTYTPSQGGQYKVYARWTVYATRATDATYFVTDDGGTTPVTVNQQTQGGDWNLLGYYSFTAGNSYPITLTDQANGGVVADAIKIVSVDAEPNTAIWHFDIPESGQYRVYGYWPAYSSRATNAGYQIEHADGRSTVLANQQQNGSRWNLLGTFNFNQGEGYNVRLTDQADGTVVADAVALSPVSAPPNRFIWHFNIPATGAYEVYARWSAYSNRATNATYVIAHDGGDTPVTVNQQQSGAKWNLLGTYYFTQGGLHYVSLTDEADGRVIADAIRLVPVTP
ncbi:putative Ig domain-containing protein [Sedimenticola sp.]|uniref:golvesin C-terminal-like domain-containing protein n=1 Tax=Sedimenticola sp. TaxID=1940285 RepID=UPI003D0CE994